MGDQGTGSGERLLVDLSASAPCSDIEDRPMLDGDILTQHPEQCEQALTAQMQPSIGLSRRCDSSHRASSSTPPGSPEALSPRDHNTSRIYTPRPEPAGLMNAHSAPAHSRQPPITRTSLSELDAPNIIHNAELRHAINFDPELHFRPNMDGEKGRRKQDRASRFWHSLKIELSMFITDRDQFHATYGKANDWTLPNLLKAVKEIIHTLVPQSERHLLDECLNIELLMQQFHKGVADLARLAQWLSQHLKCHCAPMRDAWVEAMYKQLSNGSNNSDLDEIINGLQSLLNILEAMKLDAANHLIRCLRPTLMEDTIDFEYKFFLKQIEERKCNISSASQWYKDADAQYTNKSTQSTVNFGADFSTSSTD